VKYFDAHSTGYNFIDRSDGSNRWADMPDKNQAYLLNSIPPDELAHLMEELILTGPQRTKHALTQPALPSRAGTFVGPQY
jgi:hypothetical protein